MARPTCAGGSIGFHAKWKLARPIEIQFAADYQEKGTRKDQVRDVIDFRVGIPLGGFAKLNLGMQKEPFVYEMAGDAANLPQMERMLSPFFVSRNIGAQLTGSVADGRVSWFAGWFNDWWVKGRTLPENGNDYVARVTGLACVSPDRRNYLHLGLGFRYTEAEKGLLTFQGRPESNVADRYLDTGEFPGDHASQLGLELLWNHGPISLLAEHVEQRTSAPTSGDPRFRGSYATVSWVVTGESHPYDAAAGYARRIVPEHRGGALELVGRYSFVDMRDGPIDGGVLGKWYFGVNWWTSRQWKIGVGYGLANLDKGGTRGETRMLLARIQWIY